MYRCSPHNSSEPASPTKSKYPHPALAVSAPSCAPHNQTSYFLLSLRLVRAKYPTYPTPPKSIPFLSHPSVARAICPCADTPCASPYLACGSIRASFFLSAGITQGSVFSPKITIIGVMKKNLKKKTVHLHPNVVTSRQDWILREMPAFARIPLFCALSPVKVFFTLSLWTTWIKTTSTCESKNSNA